MKQQDDLDLFTAGDGRIVAGESPSMLLDPASEIVRASFKLDAYSFQKIHGTDDELGSRLIYSSCWVRNSIFPGHFCPDCSSRHSVWYVCLRHRGNEGYGRL